jgi:DNA-binding response OmpR family regulator
MEVNLTVLNDKKPQLNETLARRVLIVDESSDSLDVLRTALSCRGVDTVTTRHATEGIDLARDFHPDLILLDLESVPSDRHDLRQNYDEAALRENAPLILVARSRRDPAAAGGQHVVSKPYHYAPLIRKIEELLEPAEHRRAA